MTLQPRNCKLDYGIFTQGIFFPFFLYKGLFQNYVYIFSIFFDLSLPLRSTVLLNKTLIGLVGKTFLTLIFTLNVSSLCINLGIYVHLTFQSFWINSIHWIEFFWILHLEISQSISNRQLYWHMKDANWVPRVIRKILAHRN